MRLAAIAAALAMCSDAQTFPRFSQISNWRQLSHRELDGTSETNGTVVRLAQLGLDSDIVRLWRDDITGKTYHHFSLGRSALGGQYFPVLVHCIGPMSQEFCVRDSPVWFFNPGAMLGK